MNKEIRPWQIRDAREQFEKVTVAVAGQITEEPLNDDGRHFVDGHYCDLTQCGHGDTGEYQNKADGALIAALWNAYRAGQLQLVSVSENPIQEVAR